jgi:tetratricopeptide (TPR) repeat protein
LERDPNNVAALNNLAWLLVTKDGRADEALRLIEQAIQLGGPVSNLLDTRGLIRLTLGQNEAALKDLEEAAAQSGSANHLFHLAKAQLRAGNLQAAADAWRKAQAAGLTAATIHPFEKEAYARLAEELGPR